jgi:hypothetical protein
VTKDYVPTCFADEVTPPPRATPDDWLVHRDGKYFLTSGAAYEDEESDVAVAHGEAVPFSRLEEFPDATLTVAKGGAWTCDPPAPEGAQHVMIDDDPDSMDDSVENLVANFVPDPGCYVLNFYTWHDEVWSFDAEAGKFVRGGR